MIESESAAVLQWYLLWFLIAIGIGRAAVWEWSILSKEGNHDNPCHKQNDGEHQQKESQDERVNNNFILHVPSFQPLLQSVTRLICGSPECW